MHVVTLFTIVLRVNFTCNYSPIHTFKYNAEDTLTQCTVFIYINKVFSALIYTFDFPVLLLYYTALPLHLKL